MSCVCVHFHLGVLLLFWSSLFPLRCDVLFSFNVQRLTTCLHGHINCKLHNVLWSPIIFNLSTSRPQHFTHSANLFCWIRFFFFICARDLTLTVLIIINIHILYIQCCCIRNIHLLSHFICWMWANGFSEDVSILILHLIQFQILAYALNYWPTIHCVLPRQMSDKY